MNSSANRGACTQICRRGYTVRDRETGDELEVDNKYIMSPKDLKTIHFLNKMIDAGVSVFKIEGRARGPEYVKIAVECCDEALKLLPTAHTPTSLSPDGTSVLAVSSTVDSGMDIIWDSVSASGHRSMVRRLHAQRYMRQRAYVISLNLGWQSS